MLLTLFQWGLLISIVLAILIAKQVSGTQTTKFVNASAITATATAVLAILTGHFGFSIVLAIIALRLFHHRDALAGAQKK